MHEIKSSRSWKNTATFLSALAPGLGQIFGNRILTGLLFGVMLPLGLGLLYATWSGFSYSHLFIAGIAVFVAVVAAADAWYGPVEYIAPCERTCPAGLHIPDYLQLLSDEEFEQGYSLIRTRLPLVGTIGRVCPHPCEGKCYRGVDGEPIAINHCKRFLADRHQKYLSRGGETAPPEPALANGPRVAIVGAGPSGLSCAYFLSVLGARVEVFDAEKEPGGRLITTIPDFRLPKEVVRLEVEDLKSRGVVFHAESPVGPGGIPVQKLLDDFDAVYLSVGAPASMSMRVEGESAFTDFQQFLKDSKEPEPVRIEGKVAVIGGGNAALDVCRTALRSGATEVHLLYRRTREQMPAREDELEAAMREGIRFRYLINPVKAVLENGKLKGIEAVLMELGIPDSSGRPHPVPIKGSEHLIEFDVVIPCLGQNVKGPIFDDPALAKLAREKDGRVKVSPATQKTSLKKLYAGGDTTRGAETAVAAIADGRKAALAIFADTSYSLVKVPMTRRLMIRKPFKMHIETQREKIRERMHAKPLSVRISGFLEVEDGFNPAQASCESKRCLQCHREL
jgi:NADPH-dependent glutamate synthase beta subunit-like oxidoreductase